VRYHALIQGQERLVEVTGHGTRFQVAIHPSAEATDGAPPRRMELDAVHLHGLALSILADTRSYACELEPGADGKVSVRVNQSVHPLEVLDERKLRMRRAGGKFSLDGPQRVDAPMPGKVVRVLVKKGDAVSEGQGLVVVEAMKMENELKSPKAGIVSELFAVEGAAVENGARLVVIA